MFEITGDEIRGLNDSDLRSLVGLLCEADLRVQGIPTAGVTWGGNQDARDGGIDVRVDITSSPNPNDFIPRAKTSYQVKKMKMPPSRIPKEMCPDGKLRPVIRKLAEASGAYIIVSGADSATNDALTDRLKAMAKAVEGLKNAKNLKLDFYGNDRLATWVRSHPSLVLWVMEKIGKAIPGWRPYDNWANRPGGLEEEYILDDEIRIHDESNPRADSMAATGGINCLRTILGRPGSSVRLVGLSGVGKTRLLQALFDDRIGENPLNPSQAFYTDTAYEPMPTPRSFIDRLIALQSRVILVIDNCPPDLHRHLTSVCTTHSSLVSLITVEYDVREDQPEETTVFRLEPSSDDLIEKMIRHRFPHIGQVDARTVAEFSGGNAKLAIAVANTIEREETLHGRKDEDLFQRLFYQRNVPNEALLRSAEVCSLLYSFDSQTADGVNLELRVLGKLADQPINELFGNVSELMRRDLVQKRGVWRAVLPPAIANWLAQRALENIPPRDINSAFVTTGSERLLKSFSRRLGYLHKSEVAVDITETWLSENGLLGDIKNLNDLGITVLRNIAPVNPEAVLRAIERAADSEENLELKNGGIAKILRSLAYYSELFDRCVNILCRYAQLDSSERNYSTIRDMLRSLFYIYLSGTHATIGQRLQVIDRLITSKNESEQKLGLNLLGAALEAQHFIAPYGFSFGAHSRNHGYEPTSRDEISRWYSEFISLAETIAISDQTIAPEVKKLLADRFDGLWMNAGIFDDLERVANSIMSKGSWNEGWLAVKATIKYGSREKEPELLERLKQLGKLLEPVNLVDRARLYALSNQRYFLEPVDIEEEGGDEGERRLDRIDKFTRSLGAEVASNSEAFNELLPEICSVYGEGLYCFGQGLAEGCTGPLSMWEDFRRQLEAIDGDQRIYNVLMGFLNGVYEKDRKLGEEILNTALTDDIFGTGFPMLQMSVEIDDRGVNRIEQSLAEGIAPISQYRYLAIGRRHERINDGDLSKLLLIIASKPDGLDIAVEILYMRFHTNDSEKRVHRKTLISTGRKLLEQINFTRERDRQNLMDYKLGGIVSACLSNKESATSARKLSKKLAKALTAYDVTSMSYHNLLESLARNQPFIFLDEFIGNEEIDYARMFLYNRNHDERNPLSKIEDDEFIRWCQSDPSNRYPLVAASIAAYRLSEIETKLEWTPLTLKIIDKAPDTFAVLNGLKRSFRPMIWSGYRSDVLQERLPLLIDLKEHEDPLVRDWAYDEERRLVVEIKAERLQEEERNRSRDERFEY